MQLGRQVSFSRESYEIWNPGSGGVLWLWSLSGNWGISEGSGKPTRQVCNPTNSWKPGWTEETVPQDVRRFSMVRCKGVRGSSLWQGPAEGGYRFFLRGTGRIQC